LEWSGASAYAKATKEIWKIDSDSLQSQNDPIAGYRKVVEDYGFTYAVVRGAGHMVPGDQPERAYDLITQFVDGN
jgi:carboxypeptidase C (cathepsin A)